MEEKQKKEKQEFNWKLALIMLTIGITWTITYYEGRDLWSRYNEAMDIWEQHKTWTIEQEADNETVIKEIVEDYPTEPETEPELDELSEISDYIWMKESSRGKNNYSKCTAQGKVNGIGYGIPGNGQFICFDSHEEEMAVLEEWIVDHFEQGLTNNELLCHYNTGNIANECDYLSR